MPITELLRQEIQNHEQVEEIKYRTVTTFEHAVELLERLRKSWKPRT